MPRSRNGLAAFEAESPRLQTVIKQGRPAPLVSTLLLLAVRKQ